jgi:hypothetical protein
VFDLPGQLQNRLLLLHRTQQHTHTCPQAPSSRLPQCHYVCAFEAEVANKLHTQQRMHGIETSCSSLRLLLRYTRTC